jgi:hypothetical protein
LITGQHVSVRRPWPGRADEYDCLNRLPDPAPGAAARGDLFTGQRVKRLKVDISVEHGRDAKGVDRTVCGHGWAFDDADLVRCWSGRERDASGDLSPGGVEEHQFRLGHVTQRCVEVDMEFGCPGLELIACRWLAALTEGEQRASVQQLQRLGKRVALGQQLVRRYSRGFQEGTH